MKNNKNRRISRMLTTFKERIFPKSVYKWYCVDERVWEEQISLLSIKYYKYSIWKNGVVYTETKLFKKPITNYIKKSTITVVYIGKKELAEKYNGSWLRVPTNYKLDLDKE